MKSNYWKKLIKTKKHGKKVFVAPEEPKEMEIIESAANPENGIFHIGKHKQCFAYTAQTVCDKNRYVMNNGRIPVLLYRRLIAKDDFSHLINMLMPGITTA